MNKTSWIIIVSVLIALGATFFLFNKFFLINGWKVVSRVSYESAILRYELSESARAGDVDKEIQIAEELLLIKKDNQAKINLANAYLEKASFDFKEEEYGNKAIVIARELLATSLEKDQEFEVYLVLGYSYEVLQDYPKSLENYNKAIEINGNSDIAYVKRGHAYDLSGDLEKAEADYVKAYQINVQSDIALYNLARVAQRKDNFEATKNYAEKALEVSKIAFVRSRLYELMGLVEINAGNYQAAIDYFSKSIEVYEKAKNSYANRAYAQIILADFSVKTEELKNKIQSDISKSLDIYEYNSFANVIEGILMQASGDNQRALESYKKALSVIDKDISLGVSEKIEMKVRVDKYVSDLEINK